MSRARIHILVAHRHNNHITKTHAFGMLEAGEVANISVDHVKRLLRTGGSTRRGYSFERI